MENIKGRIVMVEEDIRYLNEKLKAAKKLAKVVTEYANKYSVLFDVNDILADVIIIETSIKNRKAELTNLKKAIALMAKAESLIA